MIGRVAARGAKKSRMTAKTLKGVIEQLFMKHDEDNSGGIEFGAEYDSFLSDFTAYMPESREIKSLPKDQLREMFGQYDTNNDGKVTFQEFWPNAYTTFKKEGYIIDVNQIEIASQQTDQFGFSESEAGDQSAPTLTIENTPFKGTKMTEKQFETQVQQIFKKND